MSLLLACGTRWLASQLSPAAAWLSSSLGPQSCWLLGVAAFACVCVPGVPCAWVGRAPARCTYFVGLIAAGRYLPCFCALQGNTTSFCESLQATQNSNPFLVIDLRVSRNVSRIRVYNRPDRWGQPAYLATSPPLVLPDGHGVALSCKPTRPSRRMEPTAMHGRNKFDGSRPMQTDDDRNQNVHVYQLISPAPALSIS
jgi:hypothetical protein